jgi:hypothetical protein
MKVEVVSTPEVTGFSVVPGTQQRIGAQMSLFTPLVLAEDEVVFSATTDEEDAEYLCL